MEILGVGPAELAFIIIIALIVLGPKDMQKTGRLIGKWLRKIVTSDGWKLFQQTSREIQTLPNRLMREAALEEMNSLNRDIKQEVAQTAASVRAAASPLQSLPSGLIEAASEGIPNPLKASEPENTILPSPPAQEAEPRPTSEGQPRV
jgi:Sec-independent protein translocase protein TatA